MRDALNHRKAFGFFWAALILGMGFTDVDAASFLFSWKANPDPSVNAYGIYQRTGDSAYVKIDQVGVRDLDNPAQPSYLAAGLTDGNTYWFAATSISVSGAESDLSDQTCVAVDGQVVECHDEDESGTTVFVSCFINAAER